jgi:hypothetical protein
LPALSSVFASMVSPIVFCFFPIPYTKDHRILESEPASWPQ